jgi:hypothetical protein
MKEGKAGTGKSRWEAEAVPAEEQYRKHQNKWWHGYCHELHRAVIYGEIHRPRGSERRFKRIYQVR